MKFLYRNRGAVSVFLVIILVPMMLVSSMFVDASRVKLSRSVLDSATDLTLNTALTDYDTMLKDMYGLFATAQDTEELYERLEKYYTTCITSSGVSDEEAEGYVEQLMAQLGLVEDGYETADLLGLQVTDFDISKRTDASLANATILEKQIVEFMKYRAPINTGLSFLSSLKSFKTLGKQTELVEKRKDYYEGQQDVMKNAQLAWKEIYEYNKCGFACQDDYLTNMKADYDTNFENDYHKIAVKTIKDLYDTQDYADFTQMFYSVSETSDSVVMGDGGVESTILCLNKNEEKTSKQYYTQFSPYNEKNLATASDVSKCISNLFTACNALKTAYEEMIEYDSQSYKVQLIVQINRRNLFNNIIEAYKKVFEHYSKLIGAYLYPAEGVLISQAGSDIVKLFGEKSPRSLQEYADKVLDEASMQLGMGNQKIEDYNRELKKYSNEIIRNGSTDITETADEIKRIYDTSCDYTRSVTSGIEHLRQAVIYLELVYEAVKPGGSLEEKKESWKNVADDKELSNTPLASQDRAEIESLSTYLNAEDIQKLITRLENIASKLEVLKGQIETHKYFNTYPNEIDSYNTITRLLSDDIGDKNLKNVPINVSELDSQVETWIQGKYTVGTPLDISWENQSGTEPNLAKGEKLNFYSYLYGHFGASRSGEMDGTSNAEEEYQKIKDQKTTEADKKLAESGIDKDEPKDNSESDKGGKEGDSDSKEKDSGPKELIESKNRPSDNPSLSKDGVGSSKIDTSQDAAKNTSSSITDMLGDLGGAIERMGTDLRDKLYVSDYILSMFSYDTIEKEFKNKNPDGAKDAKPMSLTLTPIDAEHNFAYQNEVEYIIYGGKNASNSFKAYGSIYGIRLAFNLIYAFMDSSIRDGAFAIATPISAATLGIIPVPLIQAAIIIGVACIESSIDIAALKNGEKVPLFKDSSTWNCSVKGIPRQLGEAAKETAGDLLDYTSDKLSEMIDEGGDKVANYATSAFDDLITRNANIAIQKMTTLTSNAFEEFNRSGQDMAEYVNNGLDEWIDNERASSGGGITFTIKQEAVKIIKEQFVQRFVDAFKSCQGAVVDDFEEMGDSINSILKEIRNKISSTIVDASDEIKRYKDEMMEELKSSMKEGAEKVSETLSNRLDGTFGSGSDADDNTGMASLIQFYYSDYLRLFLMIGLYVNEEAIILRTADAIQANMAMVTNDSNYMLSKSSAYVELSATVQVQPMLLALPIFADVENNPKDNRGWYTIESKGIKGY